MCGRAYGTYTDQELYLRYLSKRPITMLPHLSPVYNLCPTQNSPVLRLVAGERQFDQMHWQLIPGYEPKFKTKLSTIREKRDGVYEQTLSRLGNPSKVHRTLEQILRVEDGRREKAPVQNPSL